MADPDNPCDKGEGSNPKAVHEHQPIVWPISPENCMRMKTVEHPFPMTPPPKKKRFQITTETCEYANIAHFIFIGFALIFLHFKQNGTCDKPGN